MIFLCNIFCSVVPKLVSGARTRTTILSFQKENHYSSEILASGPTRHRRSQSQEILGRTLGISTWHTSTCRAARPREAKWRRACSAPTSMAPPFHVPLPLPLPPRRCEPPVSARHPRFLSLPFPPTSWSPKESDDAPRTHRTQSQQAAAVTNKAQAERKL